MVYTTRMLQIAVCDDEREQLQVIHRLVQDYVSSAGRTARITDFSCAQDMLSAVKNGTAFDIALLDICLPDTNGIALARTLLDHTPALTFIFLTTSRDYAVDAFGVGAKHYLVKPFTEADFSVAMERVFSSLPDAPKNIVITGEHGRTSIVPADDIICVESVGYLRNVTTQTDTFTETRRTLREFLQEFERLAPG